MARALIRRTKQASRRRFPAEEKASISDVVQQAVEWTGLPQAPMNAPGASRD